MSSVVADPTRRRRAESKRHRREPDREPERPCTNGSAGPVPCTAGLATGNANTYFLHDWPATNSGTPPDADRRQRDARDRRGVTVFLHRVAGARPDPSNITGCPLPDLMDTNPPTPADSTPPLYNYRPTSVRPAIPAVGAPADLPSGTGSGTDSTSDCNGGGFTSRCSTRRARCGSARRSGPRRRSPATAGLACSPRR